MPSFRPLLLLPLVLAAVLLPGAARSAATATPLNVTVGPGFSIKVADASGHNVTQLDPGDYALTIKNLSLAQEHNFHITGPGGVDQFSAFDNNTVTWNLTFVDGVYKWKCDAHPTQMKGSINVGPPPPAPVEADRQGRAEEDDLAEEGRSARSRRSSRAATSWSSPTRPRPTTST